MNDCGFYQTLMSDLMAECPVETRLADMINGYWITQAVYSAAKLGIADLLSDGPRPVDELAVATNSQSDSLARLLRALASVEVFEEVAGGGYRNTPLSELLRRDVPRSQLALALMMGADQYRVWGGLADAVQSGQNEYQRQFKQPIFEHLSENPEKAAVFDQAMQSMHCRETLAVIDAYDFSALDVLVDLGGGNGSALESILLAHPKLHGILFDLPSVIERARIRLESSQLSSRCSFVSGDFFEPIPIQANALMMRHVIHDWEDAAALTILQNCHEVLPPGGKLLLVESVIPSGNTRFRAKFLDLAMMLIPGGRERTEQEYRDLYEQSGFRLADIVPTDLEISVLEGIRV